MLSFFAKKDWNDRISEYPNRRTLNIVQNNTSSMVVEVERNEGKVAQEGEAFNSENMNNLESRIEEAFNVGLNGCSISKNGNNFYITDGTVSKKLGSSEGTATTSQVLAGATFNSKNTPDSEDVSVGTMPNKGAWTSESNGANKVYIPKGYHDGNGYVDGAQAYTNGQNECVYNLGSGTSIDVKTKLSNVYSKLKTANFSVKIKGINVKSSCVVNVDSTGYSYGIGADVGNMTITQIPTLSYNATSGVLTVSNTKPNTSKSYNDKNGNGKGMEANATLDITYNYDIICNVGTMN